MTTREQAGELDRARAADLARAGSHAAAIELLEGLDDTAALDLLARMHAQRGDLAAAHATWSQVLARDPDHPSALAGIKLIIRITEGGRRARPLPVAAVAGSLAVVAVAVAAVLISVPRNEEITTAAPPVTEPVVETRTTPDPRQALMAALAAPEVVVEPRADGLRIVFQQGMFSPDSTELSPAGKRQLEQWGRHLRGQKVRVTVYGHGVVIPGGPSTGGSTTAVERAAAAVEVLVNAGDLPATAFVVRSADQMDAPHVGADPAVNRTVSLLVTPA